MKISVLGKKGQLASCFREVVGSDSRVIFYGSDEVDIRNSKSFEPLKSSNIIINCSAYTAVDKAELLPEEAFEVNRFGVIQLVRFCEENNIGLIHFSTDFVFDGNSLAPYSENDLTNPLSVYGASKLAGEEIVLNSTISALIIRTSWLYSPFGNNFCKTMLRLSEKHSNIAVVSDQIGSPTSALDLAAAVYEIIDIGLPGSPEILHISNTGQCSWAEFAKEIFKQKKILTRIDSISSEEFNATAHRPKYSVLSSEKLLSRYKISMRTWKEALKGVLKAI